MSRASAPRQRVGAASDVARSLRVAARSARASTTPSVTIISSRKIGCARSGRPAPISRNGPNCEMISALIPADQSRRSSGLRTTQSASESQLSRGSWPSEVGAIRRASRLISMVASQSARKPAAKTMTSPAVSRGVSGRFHQPSSQSQNFAAALLISSFMATYSSGSCVPVPSSRVQTLNRNSTTSPSCMTYSLPSMRRRPASRALANEPYFTSSS